jgi:hypothetical protein
MFAIAEVGIALLPLLLLVFLLPLALATFAFWIWMLVHAAQNKGLSDGEKVAWVLIIALVHFLGALIYFFVGRPKANQPSEPPVAAPGQFSRV